MCLKTETQPKQKNTPQNNNNNVLIVQNIITGRLAVF